MFSAQYLSNIPTIPAVHAVTTWDPWPPRRFFRYGPRWVSSLCDVRVEAWYGFQRLDMRQFTTMIRGLPERAGLWARLRAGQQEGLDASCQRSSPMLRSVLLTSLRRTEMLDFRMTTIGILAASAPSCFCIRLDSPFHSPVSGTLCQLVRYTGQ